MGSEENVIFVTLEGALFSVDNLALLDISPNLSFRQLSAL
jgi:hypothetical protein